MQYALVSELNAIVMIDVIRYSYAASEELKTITE